MTLLARPPSPDNPVVAPLQEGAQRLPLLPSEAVDEASHLQLCDHLLLQGGHGGQGQQQGAVDVPDLDSVDPVPGLSPVSEGQ